VEPGVVFMISLGLVFVGVDVKLLVLPNVTDQTTGQSTGQSATQTAATFHAQVGLKF
jgi:hypothetical protein